MFEYVRNKSKCGCRIIYNMLGRSVSHRSGCHRLTCQVCGSQTKSVGHRIFHIIQDLIGATSIFVFVYFVLAFGCAISATCDWPRVWGLK
jgi:hypothetical protein